MLLACGDVNLPESSKFRSKLQFRLIECLSAPQFCERLVFTLGRVCGMSPAAIGNFRQCMDGIIEHGQEVPLGHSMVPEDVFDALTKICEKEVKFHLLPDDTTVYRGWRNACKPIGSQPWFQFATTSEVYAGVFGGDQEQFAVTRNLCGLSLAQRDLVDFSDLMVSCVTLFCGRMENVGIDGGPRGDVLPWPRNSDDTRNVLRRVFPEESYRRTDVFNIGALFAFFLKNVPGTPTRIRSPLNRFDFIHVDCPGKPEIALLIDPSS